MSSKATHHTHFTLQVKSLIDRVYGRSPIKDSVLDRAIQYFEEYPGVTEELSRLEGAPKYEKELEQYSQTLRAERVVRHTHLLEICMEIISLCESEELDECHKKSAQLIGTIALLSPTEGSKIAQTNEIHKPIYKAVLALRLLDRMCMEGKIDDPYINSFLTDLPAENFGQFFEIDPEGYKNFTHQVKIPIVMAALLQDLGNYHPEAQAILVGVSNTLDPYRILEIEERKQLLQINFRETIKYLSDALGVSGYVGNSREERDLFTKNEQAKLLFIKQLLKKSIAPKLGVGNVLKVPQIYVSIILSTKSNFNYKVLPMVFNVLNQTAERGGCSQHYVDALYKITGMFPQGYGVIYIPVDGEGKQLETYEYAIVNRLYPKKPHEPLCRMATRNLAFVGFGHNIDIKKSNNLYFAETAKKMATLSKERLNEILELLSSNYEERQKLDLLPRCWHSYEYFTAKDNQKLWNKVG